MVTATRDGEQIASMAGMRRNRRYLPEHAFPEGLRVTADLDDVADRIFTRDLFGGD